MDIGREQPPVTAILFPNKHTLWEIGSDQFNEVDSHPFKPNMKLYHSIKFHALDIYNRFLLRVDPIDDPNLYKKLAWCSIYIASKYFLGEASPHLHIIFPDSKAAIKIPEIMELENRILVELDHEICKPTCFTYLIRLEHASDLFSLMLRRDGSIYGKSINDIMKKYNSN